MHKKLKYKYNIFFYNICFIAKKKKKKKNIQEPKEYGEEKKTMYIVTTMTINSGMDLLPVTPHAPDQSNKKPLNKTTKRVLVV